jgi:1-acyl-sn-glycerol-3-phosphate acyltransferase
VRAGKTRAWTRVVRLVRLCIHLVRGLLIARLRYPRLSPQGRAVEKRRWSRKLLSILAVSVRETNRPPELPPRCMLVLNHISWLDIFVIDAVFPATFVAKSEIRSWPVVGWLCTLVGTLYIERGRRAAARHAREAIAQELARGTLIAICPEGTTTFGDTLERFHAALFQPAIDAAAAIQPVALRYVDRSGARTDAAGYVGETSFLGSLLSVLSAPHMFAEITYTSRFSAEDKERRAVAETAESAIASALGIPSPRAPRRAPE